jgi:hypothetical protein
VTGTLAAAVFLFHLATSHGYGYFRDELYYLACSEHPALGYVDFGPLLAWWLRPWRIVFGDSLPALRVLPAAAAALTVVLTAAITRMLGGDRRAIAIAVLPVALAPIYVGTFSILTPNAFDVVVWTAVSLLVVRLLATPSPQGWRAVGVLLGIGLLNRQGVVFLIAGLLVGLLLTPARRLLASRGPWIAAAIAGVLVSPNLLWQAAHGWPTAEFAENARRLKNVAQGPLAFFAEQVLVLNPLAAPIWIAGLVALWRGWDGRHRALVWAYLALLALMIPAAGKAYYVTPFYPVLFAAGGVALAAARRRRLVNALVAGVVVLGAVLAPLGKPLLDEERFIPYARALGQDPRAGVGERHELGLLPQHLADQHGWPELAAKVADVYQRLPVAERARACVLTENYGQAGAVDVFGPTLGLPRAISGHNSYWLWGLGDCDFSTAIVVGFQADEVRALVGSVAEVDRVDCPYCMPHEQGPILVTHGLTIPRDELWRRIKRYV